MISPDKGILLIAEPFLKDSAFARSVVLICKHNAEEGTFGFSIHRKLHTTLDTIIEDMEEIVGEGEYQHIICRQLHQKFSRPLNWRKSGKDE